MKIRMGIILVFVVLSCYVGGCVSRVENLYDDDKKIAADSDTYGLDEEKTTMKDNIYIGNLKISGSYTIWEYTCEEDQDVEISYQFTVGSGKGKMVFISPDDSVGMIASNESVEESGEMMKKTISLKAGKNRIKVVGKGKAEISFKLMSEKGSYQ